MRYGICELVAGKADASKPVACIRVVDGQGCFEEVAPSREPLLRQLFEDSALVLSAGDAGQVYPAWSPEAVAATLARLPAFNLGWFELV